MITLFKLCYSVVSSMLSPRAKATGFKHVAMYSFSIMTPNPFGRDLRPGHSYK